MFSNPPEQFQNTPPFRADPFSLIRCESVFITMYPYRDAGQFSLLRHNSWIYPYRGASQFSDASQRALLLRHHSWMYPYRDAGQFFYASQWFFFYYVTIHGYTHTVMRVNFLMQVNFFFLLRHCPWVYPYRDAGQFFDASQRFFLTTSLFMGIPIS